jgi:hypothetical protein
MPPTFDGRNPRRKTLPNCQVRQKSPGIFAEFILWYAPSHLAVDSGVRLLAGYFSERMPETLPANNVKPVSSITRFLIAFSKPEYSCRLLRVRHR